MHGSLEAVTTVELIPGTNFAKRITCKLCGELVFEVSDRPTEAEVNVQIAGFHAHLEFRHNLAMERVACSDPKCQGDHD